METQVKRRLLLILAICLFLSIIGNIVLLILLMSGPPSRNVLTMSDREFSDFKEYVILYRERELSSAVSGKIMADKDSKELFLLSSVCGNYAAHARRLSQIARDRHKLFTGREMNDMSMDERFALNILAPEAVAVFSEAP